MPKVIATEEQWIDEGLRRFARGGPDALVVEQMAQALGCSKSSFYWYFRDRATLLSRIVEEWQRRATLQVMDSSSREASLNEAVLSLLKSLFASTGKGDFLFYLRRLALEEETYRRLLEEVERTRLDYVSGLLTRSGLSPERAALKSHLLYHYYLGWYERHKEKTLTEDEMMQQVRMVWKEFIENE
ncbi:TetR/AcrR family transcriptional regulator [Paenibacillus sp. S-38]|uniref:TetR/AcrR family transcriptional regulator n=1 Tax=Paenibacillus sp. S-38 TaxID=3416710 RepID=UPI003CF2241D